MREGHVTAAGATKQGCGPVAEPATGTGYGGEPGFAFTAAVLPKGVSRPAIRIGASVE